jgi:hypothetical protein
MAAALLWALAASAQIPPDVKPAPPPPEVRADPERSPRLFMRNDRSNEAAVCAIPLSRVPVSKNLPRMPIVRPRKAVEPMPFVKLPAPPCKETGR